MKSTKYELLKADFEFACLQLKQYKEIIGELRKENEKLKKINDNKIWSSDIECKIQERMEFLEQSNEYSDRIALRELEKFQGWLLCGDDY